MTVLGGGDEGGMGKASASERQVREALVSLPLVLDRVAGALEKVAHNTHPTTRGHVATVLKKTDGTWGVFCFGCTAETSEFTYPCRLLHTGEVDMWPPGVLIEVPPSGE